MLIVLGDLGIQPVRYSTTFGPDGAEGNGPETTTSAGEGVDAAAVGGGGGDESSARRRRRVGRRQKSSAASSPNPTMTGTTTSHPFE